MKKALLAAVSAATALSFTLAAVPAEAQHWDRDRGHDNRDHDRRGHDDHRGHDDNRGGNRWHTWGGSYGYNGYHGRWRTGQRFTNWRDSRYYISDYGRYGLPAPRRGYRYYRDSSGDIVMAAIATGLIASILSQ